MTRSLLSIAVVVSLAACGPNEAERPYQGTAQSSPSATPVAANIESTVASPQSRQQHTSWEDAGDQPREFESELGTVVVTTLTSGLEHPWGLAFLPDGRALVTERSGHLRFVDAEGTLSDPIRGVPEVRAQGQGGLLDVALSPGFETDRLVYLSFSEPDDTGAAGTSVARGRLADDRLEDVEVIFRQTPKLDSNHHYGSRLVFHDDHLFVTMGDRGQRPLSQELDGHQGTVVRLRHDGSVPTDNPFVDDDDALDEIWSYGHRNIQGAAINPATGTLWTHEHGPRGGDEINLPQPGRNYGWPLVTHGINYSGEPIPEAVGTELDGVVPAHHVWEVSPAVSGMAFVTQDAIPQWQGNVFIGALVQTSLIRLTLDGDEVVSEERLLSDLGRRIRDVREGPDGALYVLTDHSDGELLRVTLRPAG